MIKHAEKASREWSDNKDAKSFELGEHDVEARANSSLFAALLSSNMPQEEKRPRRMAHEGFEVLLAGSDTTARAMGIAVYHVLANEKIKLNLKEELEMIMPDPRQRVSLRVLEKLPWLVSP